MFMYIALIFSLLDTDLATATTVMHWRGVAVGDHLSLPRLRDSIEEEKFRGFSLVRVREVERECKSYIKSYDNGQLVSQVPSEVELQYKVQEVFVGDQTLKGAIAYGVAWEHPAESFYFQPLYSEWIPAEEDEGLWLVQEIDGRPSCISLELAGVRFPVYASGAHKSAPHSRRFEYTEVLAFAQELKNAADKPEVPSTFWLDQSASKNELVAQWATWELWTTRGEDAVADLVTICSDPKRCALAQAIADNAILISEQAADWKHSQARQAMVSRWLALDGESLRVILARYLYSTIYDWDRLGHDGKIFAAQLQQAIRSHKPNTKERRDLEKFSQEFDRKIGGAE